MYVSMVVHYLDLPQLQGPRIDVRTSGFFGFRPPPNNMLVVGLVMLNCP